MHTKTTQRHNIKSLLSSNIKTTFIDNERAIVTLDEPSQRQILVNTTTGDTSQEYDSISVLSQVCGFMRLQGVVSQNEKHLLNSNGKRILGVNPYFNDISNVHPYPNLFLISLGSMRAIINEHGQLESVDCFNVIRTDKNSFTCIQGLTEVRMEAVFREDIGGVSMYRLVTKKRPNCQERKANFLHQLSDFSVA